MKQAEKERRIEATRKRLRVRKHQIVTLSARAEELAALQTVDELRLEWYEAAPTEASTPPADRQPRERDVLCVVCTKDRTWNLSGICDGCAPVQP